MSSVAVVATLEASNVPPRVRLDVTDSGSPAYFQTTVTRLNPDGTTSPVRTFDGNPLALATSGSNRVGLLYDYEAPYQQSVKYSTVETPGASSASVTVPESRVWLIHPGIPSLSMPVGKFRPGTWTRRTAGVQQGVFQPMGRTSPIVVSDGARKSLTSSMTVLTRSSSEADALDALIADAGVLLLNIPASAGYTLSTCYVAIGAVDYAPVVDKVFEQWFDVTMPFTVVDRPQGGSQSERTYADVLAAYPTYAAVLAAYPTYAALLAGP